MKTIGALLSALLLTTAVWAQSPQKFSYQAVIRDGENNLVTSSPVGMILSILQGASGGAEIYKEIYNPNPQTNANGLVAVEIGTGIPLTGNFSTINWANGPYFIKVETDPSGGTNYTITGTTQLLSVPYSLYAKMAETFAETDPQVGLNTPDYLSRWDGNSLVSSSVYDNGNVGIGTTSPGEKLDVAGGSIRTSGQLISTLTTGNPPLLVSSTSTVSNLNTDMIDGIHASSTATANTLYPLDVGAKIPNARLYTGGGNGLDADLVDGIHASSFATSAHTHDHNVLTNVQQAGSGVTYGHVSNATQTIYGDKTFNQAVTAPSFTSSTTTGTIPLAVTSTTKCTNLNADMADGTHQAVHTQWLQIVSTGTSTLHTFVNCQLQIVGVSGRIRIKCTDGNGVDWVAYVNGVRSTGTLNNNGTKDFDINGGNDDLKIIITSSFNNLHQGIVEIHQVNNEYMSGIVWDTYSAN